MKNSIIQQGRASRTARRAAQGSLRRKVGVSPSAEALALLNAAQPVNEGAKVKLDLAHRSDLNLLAFAENHIAKMKGNANFPRPMPAEPVFEAQTQAFLEAITGFDAIKTAYMEASKTKTEARSALTGSFTARAGYVQAASNGNAVVIASSGLEVRNPRTPVGQLPWPQDLRVELNGARGLMLLNWKAVPKAKGYVVRLREVDGDGGWRELPRTPKPRLSLPDMEVGKTYAFQVAALGGTSQSLWSPEVVRAAA